MKYEEGQAFENEKEDWRGIIGTFLHNIGVLHLMIGEYGLSIGFLDKTINLNREEDGGMDRNLVVSEIFQFGSLRFKDG